MADSKPKDTGGTKHIIDVQHPGKTAPSPTSKPVIITNRKVLQDPMMADEKKSSPASPLTAPELPSESEQPKILNKKDSKKPASEAPSIAALAEAAAKRQKSAEEEVADSTKTSQDADPQPADVPPKAEDDLPKQQETPQKPQLPETEAITNDNVIEDAAQPETNKAEETEADPTPGAAAKAKNDTKAATSKEEDAAKAKHEAEVQKLVDSKQYFLPITTTEQRRSRNFVILGILISLLLAAAWVDIALDAGLIQIDNIKPLTHFFSN